MQVIKTLQTRQPSCLVEKHVQYLSGDIVMSQVVYETVKAPEAVRHDVELDDVVLEDVDDWNPLKLSCQLFRLEDVEKVEWTLILGIGT